MRKILILAFVLWSSVVNATELDPSKFGYADPKDIPVRSHAESNPNFYCEYWMDSTSTPGQKYYKCNDGTLRFGKENLWVKRDVPEPEEKPKELQDFPADIRANVPGQTLMTITAFVDDGYSYRAGKHSHWQDRPYRSISYLFVPSKEICEELAPKLAFQQFLMWTNSGRKFKVEYFCD